MEQTVVTLTDQDGNPQEFDILDDIVIEEREFLVAVSELDGEKMLFVLEVLEDGDEVTYAVPERDVCEAVIDVFAEEDE